MVIYVENPKEFTHNDNKKETKIINQLSQVAEYKVSIQKSIYFYMLVMNN